MLRILSCFMLPSSHSIYAAERRCEHVVYTKMRAEIEPCDRSLRWRTVCSTMKRSRATLCHFNAKGERPMSYSADFEKALQFRPPNIRKLFPNSRALILSGKAIDRAMLARGMPSPWLPTAGTTSSSAAPSGPPRGRRPPSSSRSPSRKGAKSLLRHQFLEPGPLRRHPLQRNGHHRSRRRPRRPLRDQERQGRCRRKGRDTDHVRRGHDLHCRRRLPPARRPEPPRQHRAEPVHSEMGRLETEVGEIKGKEGSLPFPREDS